jgi:glycosyltransferase involved in cell wall biosynthesis
LIKPRIAHVISTPEGIGGAERILIALAREGQRRGIDQVVLNPFARDPEGSELAEVLQPIAYAAHRAKSFRDLPRLRRWLLRQATHFAPSIVHVQLFHAEVLVALGSRVPGAIHVLTHQHGDFLRVQRRRLHHQLDRLAVRRYDVVVAISDSVRTTVTAGRRSPKNVVCIPNAWDGAPLPRAESLKSIVCVANFRLEKGHDVLLRAFQLVLRDHPDAVLTLLGDGKLRAQLQHEVADLGISGAVRFEGFVSDVWPHLAGASVAVVPSLYEALGIAVIEAMAAGVPVVASDVGGIPELVIPGATGILVPPGNPVALAQELSALLHDAESRERMGRAARDAAKKLHISKMVEAYFDLYERLLVDQRSPDGRAKQ